MLTQVGTNKPRTRHDTPRLPGPVRTAQGEYKDGVSDPFGVPFVDNFYRPGRIAGTETGGTPSINPTGGNLGPSDVRETARGNNPVSALFRMFDLGGATNEGGIARPGEVAYPAPDARDGPGSPDRDQDFSDTETEDRRSNMTTILMLAGIAGIGWWLIRG